MRDQPKRRVTYQYGTLARESRKRGPDVWTFRIFQIVNGRRVRCKKIIGTTAEFTEAEAERECEPLRVAANMENPHPTISMRALIYCYMEKILLPSLDVPLGGVQDEAARMGYDCASGYRSSLRNYVLPQWGSYNVRDFEKPEIRYKVEDWFQSLLRSAKNPEGLAGRSLTHVRDAWQQVFKLGVKQGFLSFNPLSEKRVELPRGCTKRSKPPAQLTPRQYLLLMSQLGILEKLAVSLEGWLGPRISEGFGLKWQDLDLESGKATFRQGFTKGRISRLKTEASRDDAPIPEDVLRLLRKWKSMTPYNAAGDWVFASPYTKGQRPFWPGPFMTGRLQPVARALGLPHIGWHTFRHSLSAWAKGARLKPEEIKTLLRHQTLKMASEVYGRLELEQKRKLQKRVISFVKKQGSAESKGSRKIVPILRKAS